MIVAGAANFGHSVFRKAHTFCDHHIQVKVILCDNFFLCFVLPEQSGTVSPSQRTTIRGKESEKKNCNENSMIEIGV